jgi:hypothetical protein
MHKPRATDGSKTRCLWSSDCTRVGARDPGNHRRAAAAVDRSHRFSACGCRIVDDGPPETEVQTIVPKQELPGGLLAFRDPRGWSETPLWLPEHQTLVFADALTERAGALRVWMPPTHDERALPDLRAMLDLPFERVIISHGEPVHTRDAFKRALKLRSGQPGLCTRPPTVAILTGCGASWRRALT